MSTIIEATIDSYNKASPIIIDIIVTSTDDQEKTFCVRNGPYMDILVSRTLYMSCQAGPEIEPGPSALKVSALPIDRIHKADNNNNEGFRNDLLMYPFCIKSDY